MNKIYYIDSSGGYIMLYEIEFDCSVYELISFLQKQAFLYCQKNKIDVHDFMNYHDEYQVETFTVEIKNKKYSFSLYTFLSSRSDIQEKFITELKITKINIGSELLI
jgi:hypothetical protein